MLSRTADLVIPVANAHLLGDLIRPSDSKGLIIFAHGSGSSRKSSRNRAVANHLQSIGFATLLFDLLTEKEEQEELHTRHLRFDIPLLSSRLAEVSQYMKLYEQTSGMSHGFFGASTGAAAALQAATMPGVEVHAVVSRGGRPDLAGETLTAVEAPTLLIVGSSDISVLELNREAYQKLRCEKELNIIAGASHLFEEPGTLEEAALIAGEWFTQHFG
ncbi:MAG: dienelactone hydrolase family protein [Verrucomicrobiales bacterium]